MSLAIQWGYESNTNDPLARGFIYFDAVTSFKEGYSGSVSEHPIDGGGNISDHFTRDNPTVTISAVISGVDVSIKGAVVQDDKGNSPTSNRKFSAHVNNPVKINTKSKELSKLIPSTVGQFFTPGRPNIVMAVQTYNSVQQIKELLKSLFKKDKTQLVTLYEYDQGNLRKKPIKNLVMVTLDFNEDSESGDALYCDIALKQISIVSSRKSQIPQDISQAAQEQQIADQASLTSQYGSTDSTEVSPNAIIEGIIGSDSATPLRVFVPKFSSVPAP